MSEQKKPRPKRKPPRKYIHKTNAVCVTIHSADGSSVPRPVIDAAADSVSQIARDYNLLVNVAEV